jgi:methionyl-tRNA formyltransferase
MAERTSPRPQIVFIGSGPVAAASLELLAEWCDIEAVITKPQPPHHKELFPVIDMAERYELPMHFANTKASLDVLFTSHQFAAPVGVLIDYGVIVSQAVIDNLELGIINSHFSVLPEWRGADPISFSVLSGQPSTGVSLMLLVEKMDEGPLIGYGEYDLPATITTPELTDDLIQLSNGLLKRCLPLYIDGNIQPQPQSVTGRQVSYSRKLTKADGVLDFSKPAAVLEREIRAFAEWPKSRTTLAGKDVVVTAAHVSEVESVPPGGRAGQAFVSTTSKLPGIGIVCNTDVLIIDRLKPAGKPEMTAQAFLAGNSL